MSANRLGIESDAAPQYPKAHNKRETKLAETIRENGERHLANAVSYAARGLPEYSAGSQRKAERNFKRAKALEWPPDPLIDGIVASLRHSIEQGLIHGHRA